MSVPDFEPMQATRWPVAFDDPGWWFEVKWDGYRAIVSAEGGRVRARSRRGLDLTGPFPELATLPIPDGIAVDGEVVAFDEQGRPSFSNLQRRTGFGGRGTGAGVGVNLVVFDLLFAGESLTGLPYKERRARLEEIELPEPIVVPEPVPEKGLSLFEAAQAQGLEGIVAKRGGSLYLPGRRSPDWRKVSVKHHLRAVVGGYLPGEGGRASTFGAILVGLHDEVGLRWIAAVGSGFDESALTAFSAALRQLERPSKPFYNEVVVPNPHPPVWVEPGIVVDVEFKEWTHDSHLRAPVYKGIEIADPETVTWEEEGPG
ncbi:MAG TPA: non-homologous end-joining DNA ligase [Acidimicrobiia bacterium]|nr:non-homologous end-joining DNA ligase [Acidimicrobiia bacterium]